MGTRLHRLVKFVQTKRKKRNHNLEKPRRGDGERLGGLAQIF